MEPMEHVKMLQMMYAGVLADAVLRYGQEGVLEHVTQTKFAEQLANGKARAAQMGITNTEEVFAKLTALMGCADWATARDASGVVTATATRCMLCAMAKRIGAQSPCNVYCLDPMEGMVRGLNEKAVVNVEETLYSGAQCRVRISE
jgi:hypothetical protein